METRRSQIRSCPRLPAPGTALLVNENTRNRWTRLWRNASFHGHCDSWFDIVVERYSESHRHSHTIRHIEECLNEFDAVRHLATQPVAVELAIWFHDAIYDTHASDNEEQSALLAEQ